MQSCISYYINNLTIAYYSSGFVKWNLSESIRDTVILLFFLYLFRIFFQLLSVFREVNHTCTILLQLVILQIIFQLITI